MKLTIGDKLALIYTSTGSQRAVARATGLSRYAVSNILHKNLAGESLARYESNADTAQKVSEAFAVHKDLARGVARRHQIPFDGSIPVYTERLPLKSQGVYVGDKQVFRGTPKECANYIAGKLVKRRDESGEVIAAFKIDPANAGRAERKKILGARAGALHLHWLPDRLRDAYVKAQTKSQAYYAFSIGSNVNLRKYNRQAEERNKDRERQGLRRTKKRLESKLKIQQQIRHGAEIQRIFTPMISMQGQIPEMVALSSAQTLENRHSSAVGDPGTTYGDQMLFQIDTRESKNAKAKSRVSSRRK